jgi:3-hydroxyisobutyrate dehydrogenase-like beta-hydroxyacid dehydrogenase
MMKIGFLGLGAMGRAIACNLIKAGHTVTVWNRTASATEEFAQKGATVAAEAAQVLAGADVVVSMLADDLAVRAVLIDSGLLTATRTPQVHVCMSTISVALADELSALHAKAGSAYVAAPVVGRPNVAEAGMLQILAAGAPDALACVQPLFDVVGKKTWMLGDRPSQANVMKLAVNFMLVSAIETMGEAAALVDSYGVPPAALIDLVSASIFPGPVYQGYGATIVNRSYEPAGFKARLGLKDIRLALAAGESNAVPLPIASLLRDSLIDALAHRDGEKDLAVLAQGAMRRAGRD